MTQKRRDITLWIAERGGPVVNLVWLAVCGWAAFSLYPVLELPLWALIGGMIAIMMPALVGLVLHSRLDRDFERFVISMLWTAMAVAVTATGGGMLGLGLAAFLLPAAIAAASGDREAIIKAAAVAFAAALVTGVLQGLGFIAAAPQAVAYHLPFIPGVVFILAWGFGCAATRAVKAADLVRAEAERGRARSLAFDAAPAALAACDQDGNVLATSQGLRDLSPGLPRSMADLPVSDLGFDEEDRVHLSATVRRGAASKSTNLLSLRGERGRSETVRVDAQPIPGGSVVGFASDDSVVVENMLREAEEARRDAIEDARAKSQFLASVSHELRTPLNAIIGFSDVMKTRLFGPLPARYAEYADLIHESGGHLMELIGDVLDMSKIEADRYELVKEQFDVGEVVGVTAKMMRLQAEEAGLTLSIDPIDEPILVDADRKALRQILLNLLSNAVKFTPSGGAVVVMARALGSNLVLAVGDSGVGLEPEEAETLGKPYQQAGNARDIDKRGTGLGLSLVRALAELHGGTMSIASRKGVGTTVTVNLPILVQQRGAVVEAEDALDVRQQIERAQSASKTLASA
ncbi:MAG: HAMP domain-containing histidine kinase [Alphaproteobacteria bacterium]|nr:HAMP domain-containing histidine kinase [Alphaproteobacteria bacterium]